MQSWALLLAQKTSRQQAVTPRFAVGKEKGDVERVFVAARTTG
jgi:hypothetical protein